MDIKEDILNLIITIGFATLCISLFKIDNYFYFIIPVFLYFFITYFVKYFVAKKLDFRIKTKFLMLNRFWFSDQYKAPFPIPIWAIIPLLFSTLSYGGIQILTILGNTYEERIGRITRKFPFKEQDLAKISIVGLISGFVLLIIFYFFDLKEFAIVTGWLLISNALPFGNLDGAKIFHASWIVWCFYFSFFIISLIMIYVAGLIASILLGLILACSIAIYLLCKYL